MQNTTKNIFKKSEFCDMWNVSDKNFIYPELSINQLKNKHDIGISLPGGGVCACVYSLGVLRGLHILGILSKVKYISSVSGSSWLNAIDVSQKYFMFIMYIKY